MPWVKTEVDDRVNQAIERVQDQYDMNKSEATLYLLRQGTHTYENENYDVYEHTDGFTVE